MKSSTIDTDGSVLMRTNSVESASRDADSVNFLKEKSSIDAPTRDSEPFESLAAEVRSLSFEIEQLRLIFQSQRTTAGANHQPPAFGPVKEVLTTTDDTQKQVERPQKQAPHLWNRFLLPPRQEWRPGNSIWWDVATITAILIVAIAARFYHLKTIPLGIQDDESMMIFQGAHQWSAGWTGVWNPQSGGIPAGFVYLSAPMIRLFGPDILAIRYLSAGLDVLTASLVYVTVRRAFGFCSASVAALLYAVSPFQILFSRIAFQNILWPALVMCGLCAFVEALRRDHLVWWATSGFFLGLAIYSYNAHALYIFVLFTFFAWYFASWRIVPALGIVGAAWFIRSPLMGILLVVALAFAATAPEVRVRRVWWRATAFGGAYMCAMFPMLSFMYAHPDAYFNRTGSLSIFNREAYTSLTSNQERVEFVWHRYTVFWSGLTRHPWQNIVDGSGAAPFVPLLMFVLALGGIGFCLARRRHPLVLLGILTLIAAPIASLWTADFGIRRAMVIMPFVCMFVGVGLVELVRLSWRRNQWLGTVSVVIAIALVAEMSWRSLDNAFAKIFPSPYMHLAMSTEWVDAVEKIDGLPGNVYVYAWSPRWPWGHITGRLLAPDVPGTSRGEQYGDVSMDVDYTLGRPVILLYYDYQKLLPEYEAMYPGGEVILGPKHWDTTQDRSYTIYILPEYPQVSP